MVVNLDYVDYKILKAIMKRRPKSIGELISLSEILYSILDHKVKRLIELGLVTYDKTGELMLTPKGVKYLKSYANRSLNTIHEKVINEVTRRMSEAYKKDTLSKEERLYAISLSKFLPIKMNIPQISISEIEKALKN